MHFYFPLSKSAVPQLPTWGEVINEESRDIYGQRYDDTPVEGSIVYS